MVKFVLGKLLAFFPLSVHMQSAAQQDSDTKRWEKHLWRVWGKRRDRISF